jgi:hypothetical protein
VQRTPLPTLPPNDAMTPREAEFRPTPAVADPDVAAGPVAQQIAFEDDPVNAIIVADALHSAHPLVRGSARSA